MVKETTERARPATPRYFCRWIKNIPVIFLLTIATIPANAESTKRWYSSEHLQRGKTLYLSNCAVCHGQQAEGTLLWKKRLPDDSLPPPPLNGTAHSWHHQLPILGRAIREGGESFGGKMPPFKDKLNENQIDDIIAWFQSHWSDEIYSRWNGDGVDIIQQPAIIKELLQGL